MIRVAIIHYIKYTFQPWTVSPDIHDAMRRLPYREFIIYLNRAIAAERKEFIAYHRIAHWFLLTSMTLFIISGFSAPVCYFAFNHDWPVHHPAANDAATAMMTIPFLTAGLFQFFNLSYYYEFRSHSSYLSDKRAYCRRLKREIDKEFPQLQPDNPQVEPDYSVFHRHPKNKESRRAGDKKMSSDGGV